MKHLLSFLFLCSVTLLFGQDKNLFLKDQIQLSNFKKDQYSKNAVQNKVVAVNFNFINQKSLEISLFGDTITAQFKTNFKTPIGTQSWFGYLKNQKKGYAIFTKNKNTFFGKILTDSGKSYLIKPIENTNYYQVSELINDTFKEECEIDNFSSQNKLLKEKNKTQNAKSTKTNTSNVCNTEEICTQTNVDLIVFYTSEAMKDLGGQASTEAAIATAAAEINVINANSKVNHTMTLVHTALTNFKETSNQDLSDVINLMKNPSDGVMDEIPILRDQYYADLVSLITFKGSSSGTGNVNTDPNVFNPQTAYSAVKSGAMLSQYTLAHETGHNLGLRHDRYAYNYDGSALPNVVCSPGWGWVNANASSVKPNSQWRTIMAYNKKCEDSGFDCDRIPYFSNPDLTYNGDPLGANIGSTNEANNASILNRSYCKVADFRIAPCSDCDFTYNGGCTDYNPNSSNGPGNTTNIVIKQTMLPAQIGNKVTLYITYSGDHGNSSEQFNILDENNNVIGQTTPLINDCNSNRIEINVPVSDFNNWITDGIVTIKLNPQSTNINPTYCTSGNYACAEFGVFSSYLNSTDFEINETISIYPNPTNDSFEIKSNTSITNVKIYNSLGQFLFESNNKIITLKNYPIGLYLIKATSTTNKTYTKKIIKK